MTITQEEYDFEASQGAEVAKESNKGGDFQKEIEFLSLKGDKASISQGLDKAIVRLVTEYEVKDWMDWRPQGADRKQVTRWNFAWITVAQHYAPTKQRPPYAREGARWPEKMFAVCRRDKIFKARYNDQCPVCNQGSKATDRSWALGIEREQVVENGRILGYRDKMREVLVFDEKGEAVIERVEGEKKIYAKKWVPAYVVLNYGWKNFFNALSGQAGWHKTVLDRDYVIQRSGEGANDTSYAFIPLDPIILDGDNPWGLPAGSKYDLGAVVGQSPEGRPIPLMEVVYPDMPDLRKLIVERTSEDFMGRWFIPGWLPANFDPSKATTSSSSSSGSSQPPQGYMPSGGAPAQQGQPGMAASPQQGYMPGGQPQGQPQGGYQQPQTAQQPAVEAPAPAQQDGPPAGSLDALKSRVLGTPQDQPQGQPQQ